MSDESIPDPHEALELVSLFCGTEATQIDGQVIRARMINPFTGRIIDFRARYYGSPDDLGWVVQFFEDYDAEDRRRLGGRRAPDLADAISGAWDALRSKYPGGAG